MQYDPEATQTVRSHANRTRLVGMHRKNTAIKNNEAEITSSQEADIALQRTASMKNLNLSSQPTTPHPPLSNTKKYYPANDLLDTESDIENQITSHLLQLSGSIPAIHLTPTIPHRSTSREEALWPNGIQQTGPLPVINLYGREPFGRTPVQEPASVRSEKKQPAWKSFLATPAAKVMIGLIIGIGLLLLVSRIVDIPTTIHVLQKNLATPRGILLVFLSGIAFLLAFSIRGIRWKLFLSPIGKVSTFKAIQLFLVGIFLNFLLPVRGGEVAKSLMLKRIAGIPVSQSLPTVAMDKALDLMPALFIMAIVPFLGVQMSLQLWLVLAIVGGLLIGLMFFIGIAAWKRTVAIALLQKLTGLLPKSVAGKIEGFATGFVDSLLMGASRPKIFIPAVLLTCVAVIFDGLFAMLAFWTIGYTIPFGTAIFGYTVYNMFYILPTPPGQVGSNEVIGLLVFNGLLHLPANDVTAMFIFSHPYAALLMFITGMACLSGLGLTISSAMRVQTRGEEEASKPQEQVTPA